MKLHREFAFEESICAHLGANGWLYEPASHSRYDAARALFLEDAVAWVQETQPDAWAKLTSTHGAAASGVLGDRLRAALDSYGVISVLRNGFDVMGLKGKIQMCQFKPALGMNAALQAAYTANRVRVVNQVRYSLHNGNEIDLVFFVNGVPVSTVELKSQYTQSVHDAGPAADLDQGQEVRGYRRRGAQLADRQGCGRPSRNSTSSASCSIRC